MKKKETERSNQSQSGADVWGKQNTAGLTAG